MGKTTPLAYNTGSLINGTTQVGNFAVGISNQDYSSNLGGVIWWMSPNQDLGYVIAKPVPGNTQPTPIFGVTASFGFYRTKTLSDNEFIGLSEYVSSKNGTPQTFSTGNQASAWLTNNGYWNSWSGVTNNIIIEGFYFPGSVGAGYLVSSQYPLNSDTEINFTNTLSTISGSPLVISGSVQILAGSTTGYTQLYVDYNYNNLTQESSFENISFISTGTTNYGLSVEVSGTTFNVTPTPTPSITQIFNLTPTPSVTSTQTPTNTLTPTPSVTSTQTPTNTLTQTPTKTLTPTPTKTLVPSFTPTPTPTLVPIVSTGLILNLDAGNTSSYPGSGAIWTDTQGGKQFTLYNGPTYTSSNGGYINFVPASSQYGYATSFDSTLTRYTVEVWHLFNGTLSGAAPVLFGEGRAATSCNFMMGTTGGQTNPLKIQGGYWTGVWQQGTSLANGDYYTPSNGWYQFVNTYDGANIKFYQNSNLVINKTPINNYTPNKSGLGLNIMRRQDVANYWGGGVSIIRVYSRALTLTEITQNFNANKSRYGL